MPRLRDISGRKLVKIFENFGFEVIGQKGSHIKMSRADQILVIPNHKSIAKGTLKEIYSQASEFISEPELKKIFYT
ncbi:MAG: type II toxin-antitoxin system HicA family toxin [Candidatus Zambryskibacteria bacterium]|nr:type II toxin-antitoxin system HicA family toxin [Candidatus Zambryskibacteria bacterium]